MKPLYLCGGGLRVELDGPALKVRHPERADAWFPLGRVSRVITARGVEWQWAALIGCAEAGITVTLLADDGAPLAKWVGRPDERIGLGQRMQDFLQRPDWSPLYRQWLAGMERMVLRSVARRIGLAPENPVTARELHQWFRAQAKAGGFESAHARVGREIQGLLTSRVVQLLNEVELGGEFAEWPGLGLSDDFVALLFWDFQSVRIAWLTERTRGGRGFTPETDQIVALFEHRRERTERLLMGLINRFHLWLIGL